MTINVANNTPRNEYTVAEGVASTPFAIDFEFYDNSDVVVYKNSSLINSVNYTISGGDGSTGTLTYSFTGGVGGDTVTIIRDIALERTTDFPSQGAFQISSLNTELDRFTAIASDIDALTSRSLRLEPYDTTVSLTLPNATSRANKVLAFASDGSPSATTAIGNYKGNWAAQQSYDERDVVKDTSTNNIFIATIAHISSGSEPLTTNTDSAKWSLLVDAASAATSETNAAASATSASDDADDAGKLAKNPHNSQYTLSDGITLGYSALHYATEASASATSALGSSNTASGFADAAQAARDAVFTGLDSFDDRYLGSMADTQTQSVVNTTATWVTTASQETQITVANATGITVGMVVSSASGFLAGTNVVSIDGTTIHLNNVNQASATNQAVTFTGYGVLGNFDVGLDGPSTDNDNNSLAGGQLYFNSTDAEIRLYNGTSWVAAYVSGGSFVSKSGDIITGTLNFDDNVKATFGDTTTPDLEIFHDTTDSIINDAGAGNLKLQSGGTTKLEVTGTGATVTGILVSDGLNLGDSEYLNIGNSSDLKLYHDGSNSYISEEGQGNLNVRGSTVGLGYWSGSAFYKGIEATGVGGGSIKFFGVDVFDQQIFQVTRGGMTFESGENSINNVNIRESVASVSSSNNSTNLLIYLSSYFYTTLSQNTTFVFSSPPSNAVSIVVEIKRPASGAAYTVGWPASVKWAGGSAPTLSSGANDVDILTFITRDSGTNWYGFAAGLDMS